jgi:hypothetical protein
VGLLNGDALSLLPADRFLPWLERAGTFRRQQLLFLVTGNDFEAAMRNTLAIGSKIHLLLILSLRSQ